MKVCYNTNLPFLNNPKDLDLSYKMDLDLWGCFGRKIIPSYNRRNMVLWLQEQQSVNGKTCIIWPLCTCIEHYMCSTIFIPCVVQECSKRVHTVLLCTHVEH